MRGRPKKFSTSVSINFCAEKEFKERLYKIAERNNSTIYDVIFKSVNFMFPVVEDLELEEKELQEKIDEIRFLRNKKIAEEKSRNEKLLEIKVKQNNDKLIREEYYVLRESNKELMDFCYRKLRDDVGRNNMIFLYSKCIELFKSLESSGFVVKKDSK